MINMNTFDVDSIEEAVALAERFRQDGRYDLFRGQRENWPVVPTLARLGEDGQREARERLTFFFSWLEEQPELSEIADRQDPDIVDQKYAVAQHYGIPTTFCDFTTEPAVAGFFASSANADSDGASVIVCCNSMDLLSVSRSIFPSGHPQPEVLRITVQNLWRLQAQAGVFLFLPYSDFEEHYEFDRIIFPAGSFRGVASEDIYPTRRSQLEVHLDQFFRKEEEAAHHDAVMNHASDLWVSASPSALHMIEETLIDGDPGPHHSWIDAAAEWDAYRVEPWTGSSATRHLEISDDLSASATKIRDEIRERVLTFCCTDAAARSTPVRLSAGGQQFDRFIERLQMVWDGVRTYPYSDDEVADAVANTAFLGRSIAEIPKPAGWACPNEHVAKALWEEPLQVEFGRRGAAAATGYADGTALRSCVRPDLLELLKPNYRHLATHAVNILSMVPVPSRAFVFESFAKVFVTQVVPSQVILFTSRAHYFSPTQLGTFGLP
jgi:hypothetical protein